MTPEAVLGLAREALVGDARWSARPALLAALVVGVLISLLQALTQIQENTLSFLPKLLAILARPAADPAVRLHRARRLHPRAVRPDRAAGRLVTPGGRH